MAFERQSPFFKELPVFKPKLPKKSAPGRYFFVNILDKWIDTANINPIETQRVATMLLVEYKILEAPDGKVVASKKIEATLVRKPVPLSIFKLPLVPCTHQDFSESFQKIKGALFSEANPGTIECEVEPACLVITNSNDVNQDRWVSFEVNDSMLLVKGDIESNFFIKSPFIKKDSVERNLGGRLIAGMFTLSTGLNAKSRVYKYYTAKYPLQNITDKEGYEFVLPFVNTTVVQFSTYGFDKASRQNMADQRFGEG